MYTNKNKDDSEIKIREYSGGYAQDYLDKNGLEVMRWPDTQGLCELPGFEEHSWLINDDAGLEAYGPSAYVVESGWYETHSKP